MQVATKLLVRMEPPFQAYGFWVEGFGFRRFGFRVWGLVYTWALAGVLGKGHNPKP